MLSVGHQCIKLNFQNQNQGAFEDLLNEVKTRIKVVEEKDENKKGEDQQKVAFQVFITLKNLHIKTLNMLIFMVHTDYI